MLCRICGRGELEHKWTDDCSAFKVGGRFGHEGGQMAEYRQFETGATRDLDADKFDYEGFLSPLVLERYARYMHKNRVQADGSIRASDNWQKGIPTEAYMKSLLRHVIEVWKIHRDGHYNIVDLQDALCAVIFNAQGYLFEELK